MGAFCTWVGMTFTLQERGLTLQQFATERPEHFLGLWHFTGGARGVA